MSKKSKLILTDIDETILNFSSPFQKWLEQQGFYSNYPHQNVNCAAKIYGISHEQADRLVLEFCSKAENINNLPPLPDALVVLPYLYNLGYDFVAISSFTEKAVHHRIENIQKAFGFNFSKVYCVGLGGEKRMELKKYSNSYWVEDNLHHATVGNELGHNTFLLNRSYNKDDNFSGTRVNDWFEIRSHILTNNGE